MPSAACSDPGCSAWENWPIRARSIPVLERDSGKFLGTVTNHDVLDLVVLMDEIQDEV